MFALKKLGLLFIVVPAVLFGHQISEQCHNSFLLFFRHVFVGHIVGVPYNLSSYSVPILRTEMIKAGVPIERANLVTDMLAKFQEDALGNAIAFQIRQSMEEDLKRPPDKRLVTCILLNHCLPDGKAMFMAFDTGFRPVDPVSYYQFPKITKPEAERFKPGDLDTRLGGLILPVPSLDETKPHLTSNETGSAIAEIILHELCHFSDDQLLKDWIWANLNLIKKGEEPDHLFRRFVRFNPEHRGVVIYESFLRLFKESRGYYTGTIAHQFFEKEYPNIGSLSDQLHRAFVLEKTKKNCGAEILKDFQLRGTDKKRIDITEKNIFEVAVALGEQMKFTIDRANNP